MPEIIAKKIFKPLVVRRLKQSGIPAGNALKYVNDDHPLAKNALINVMEESPVIINRAPSLHKHSVQAFRPILMDGKDIRLNPMVVGGFNADFDGDTMSVMLPITYEGQQEAFGMFPSKILFKHGDNSLMPGLSQEFVYGISKLSEIEADTGKTFKSIDEAKVAKLDFNEQFTLNGKKMTIGQ